MQATTLKSWFRSSQQIIFRVSQLRKMRWVRSVTRMSETRNAYRFLFDGERRNKERDYLKDLVVDGRATTRTKPIQVGDKCRVLANTVMSY